MGFHYGEISCFGAGIDGGGTAMIQQRQYMGAGKAFTNGARHNGTTTLWAK